MSNPNLIRREEELLDRTWLRLCFAYGFSLTLGLGLERFDLVPGGAWLAFGSLVLFAAALLRAAARRRLILARALAGLLRMDTDSPAQRREWLRFRSRTPALLPLDANEQAELDVLERAHAAGWIDPVPAVADPIRTGLEAYGPHS